MPSFYKGKIPIIRRSLNEGFLRGEPAPSEIATGCVPRDYSVDPVEMRDSPDAMKLVADSDVADVVKAMDESQSGLEHIFLRGDKPAFDLLDQNGDGYCWSYSVGHCIMLDRLKQNLPMVRINPHATAAIIKGGRDEGGWCGLSMKWARANGYAEEGAGLGQWPLHSRNLRYDTPELREAMALHKAEEDWYDLGRKEWDQKLSRRQLITCGLNNIPCAVDYNRFGHSMCQVGIVMIDGAPASLILNSWKSFGYFGLCVLAPDIWPDNSVGLRSSTPSAR